VIAPRHSQEPDHSLPPPDQRDGGTLAPPPKGCLESPCRWPRLGPAPLLGPARPQDVTSRGLRNLTSRSSFWGPAHHAWPVPGPPELPSAPFLDALRAHVDRFYPAPPAHHTSPTALPPPNLPAALLSARMVLVRNDGHIPPLGLLYSGPYKVLERSLHFFKLIRTRTDIVSTHRLKAALLPEDAAVPPQRGRPLKPKPQPPPPPAPPAARRVTFDLPLPQPTATSGRPVRNHRQPARLQSSP
jgi:hypothetical protein